MADPTPADPAIPRPQLVLRLLEIASTTWHDEVRRAALAEIAAIQNPLILQESSGRYRMYSDALNQIGGLPASFPGVPLDFSAPRDGTVNPANLAAQANTAQHPPRFEALLGADLVERANTAASVAGGSVDAVSVGEPDFSQYSCAPGKVYVAASVPDGFVRAECFGEPGYRVPGAFKP